MAGKRWADGNAGEAIQYGFAERLARLIGAAAMGVVMRLSSFLLVCIGVQILWNGVSALLHTLPGISR